MLIQFLVYPISFAPTSECPYMQAASSGVLSHIPSTSKLQSGACKNSSTTVTSFTLIALIKDVGLAFALAFALATAFGTAGAGVATGSMAAGAGAVVPSGTTSRGCTAFDFLEEHRPMGQVPQAWLNLWVLSLRPKFRADACFRGFSLHVLPRVWIPIFQQYPKGFKF